MIITRFAPSPTGFLHIGGVRTALFSWLHARQNNGKFILRIEDTDQQRSTPESVEAILDGMRWLGLDYDEGPIYQTRRFARYQEVIKQLLADGYAYKCYCSKDRLNSLREKQRANKIKPRYDGTCRQLTKESDGQEYVVRFKNPLTDQVIIDDLTRGTIAISNSELDDLVIARADGSPTYNLTVVVDDMDMGITHVIRGDDHINNTPRQVNIFKALGGRPPQYAHVPMILGSDGTRLSKRHGAVSILQYKEDGFLPEALLNYLVRLGWAYQDQEIFSREDMLKLFSIKEVNLTSSIFDPKKLLWLNQQYIIKSEPEYLAKILRWHLQEMAVDCENGPELTEVVTAQKSRVKTMLEMANASKYFYQNYIAYDAKTAKEYLTEANFAVLQALLEKLEKIENWQIDAIKHTIREITKDFAVGFGKVALPFRVAITGVTSSPSIDLTAKLIGKSRVLQRLGFALASIDFS